MAKVQSLDIVIMRKQHGVEVLILRIGKMKFIVKYTFNLIYVEEFLCKQT